MGEDLLVKDPVVFGLRLRVGRAVRFLLSLRGEVPTFGGPIRVARERQARLPVSAAMDDDLAKELRFQGSGPRLGAGSVVVNRACADVEAAQRTADMGAAR